MIVFGGQQRLLARDVGRFVQRMRRITGVPMGHLAQSVAMPESQLNRIVHMQRGWVRAQTVYPLHRVKDLVEAALRTLTINGVKTWLTTPHPELNDVPPILHLRSEKELGEALNVLAAIEYGFPA